MGIILQQQMKFELNMRVPFLIPLSFELKLITPGVT